MEQQNLSKESIIEELQTLKQFLTLRYGVSRIGLFGSFARNQARPESTIDIVVELLEPDMFALVHMKETFEEIFQHSVDIVSMTELINASLKERIEHEAIFV